MQGPGRRRLLRHRQPRRQGREGDAARSEEREGRRSGRQGRARLLQGLRERHQRPVQGRQGDFRRRRSRRRKSRSAARTWTRPPSSRRCKTPASPARSTEPPSCPTTPEERGPRLPEPRASCFIPIGSHASAHHQASTSYSGRKKLDPSWRDLGRHLVGQLAPAAGRRHACPCCRLPAQSVREGHLPRIDRPLLPDRCERDLRRLPRSKPAKRTRANSHTRLLRTLGPSRPSGISPPLPPRQATIPPPRSSGLRISGRVDPGQAVHRNTADRPSQGRPVHWRLPAAQIPSRRCRRNRRPAGSATASSWC